MKISWQKTKEEKGVLIAFDGNYQPLLLWWYQTLRKYSALPVAFVDLGGISDNVKQWCKKSGYYINNEKYVSYFKKIKTPMKRIKKWKKRIIKNMPECRSFWHAKPIAMMHSPFEKTLYLDIDCEVKNSIDDIFSFLDTNEIGLCEDLLELLNLNKEKCKIYNSGVIVYKSKSKIIEHWAKSSLDLCKDFFGDQDLLSYLIHKYKYKPAVLAANWNWQNVFNENNLVNILHWIGGYNKLKLIEKIKNDVQINKDIENLLFGK